MCTLQCKRFTDPNCDFNTIALFVEMVGWAKNEEKRSVNEHLKPRKSSTCGRKMAAY